MVSLMEAFGSIPDARTRKGRRYELPPVLLLSVAAMMSGANDLLSIRRFGKRLTPAGLAMLGFTRGRAPAHSTLHYVFRALEAEHLKEALRGLVRRDEGLGHVAIDGKRLRGSQHLDSPGIHMLSAFASSLSACIGALTVPPDSGEMPEALVLLRDLPIGPGDVVTGDAAFTYAEVVQAIREKGADYFLFVKGNQPALRTELAQRFGDLSPLWRAHCRQGRRRAA